MGFESFNAPIENIEESHEEVIDLSDTTKLENATEHELQGRLTALNQFIEDIEEALPSLSAAKKRQAQDELNVLEHQVELVKSYILSKKGNNADAAELDKAA